MILKQIFSLNFMFLYSLIEELSTKEENNKTGCSFNFEHQCNIAKYNIVINSKKSYAITLLPF